MRYRLPTPFPSPALRDAVREASIASPLGRSVARTFGLVAIGERPAGVEQFTIADGRLTRSALGEAWDPARLLDALRAEGLVVLTLPVRIVDVLVAVAPDERRARRVGQLLAKHWEGRASSSDEMRLGALLGYPRSGCEAYVGRRPRASGRDVMARLSLEDRRFAVGVVANDERSIADAVATFTRFGRSFREAFGDFDADRVWDALLSVST